MTGVDVPFGSIGYPTDLPLSEIQSIIDIIRHKAFVDRKEELAKGLWIIIGYGLGRTLKDPSVPGLATGSKEHLTDDQALEVLESMVAPQGVFDFPIPDSLIRWAVELLISKLLNL